ncbi:MAG TPA: metallophosphoesterase [Acetobacteraceae bacterium]|jgi:predicted phosphodiesterase|nr:metallophosphoesterase [Acetobacteraceae bacterium]
MTIVFIGDVHQQWQFVERGLASLHPLPHAAILLGDLQCDRPLDELAAPLLDRGIDVHWIFGNHDNDGGPEMWANLVEPQRNPRTRQGALHGKVAEIAGVRIAGLGGTFRPRIWEPPESPRLHRREQLPEDLASLGPAWPKEHIAALVHSLGATAIWPEDYDELASQRADILVTHEAPRSHPAGNAALDALARAMGASLIVHGHHHVTYRAIAPDGLRAMGVAAAWGANIAGRALWPGEVPRQLGQLIAGWSLEVDAANQ